MNSENSKIRLEKMEAKVDEMSRIAKECIACIERILAVAKGEKP